MKIITFCNKLRIAAISRTGTLLQVLLSYLLRRRTTIKE